MSPRCVAIWVGVALCLVACQQREKEAFRLRGRVHCGAVMPCRGDRFLIYTDYGGKVIRVLPVPGRGTEDIQKRLADGVEVEIEGVRRDQVRLHTHTVAADRIHFLGSGS